jgi:hypothetical protein
MAGTGTTLPVIMMNTERKRNITVFDKVPFLDNERMELDN